MSPVWGRCGVLAAVLIGLVGCAGPVTGGGGDDGMVCVPGQGPGRAMLGGDVLENPTDEAVTTDKVRLVDATNFKQIEAVLVFLPDGEGTIAARPEYPPPAAELAKYGFPWHDRIPAEGATFDASDGRMNLIVGVELVDTSRNGRFDSLDVYYTEQSGRKQRVRTSTALLLPPPRVQCRDIMS